MKSLRPYLAAFFALVAVAACAVAWNEYQELLALRAQALSPAERAQLQKNAWDAQRRLRELEALLAARRGQASDGADGAGVQNRALAGFASDWMARMDDPEVRRLMAIQQTAQINRQFAALYKRLNLTPDQLSQFQSLMLEKRNVQFDVLAAASQQGINPMQNPDEFKQMIASAEADLDQKIQTDLGPDNYSQFQSFQQTQGQRSVAGQLQQDLSYTDSPLTPTQRDQMVQILAQTAPAKPAGAGAAAAGAPPGEGPTIVTDATISLAQNVLSPDQIKALQGIQQQQQANLQLRNLMLQAQNQSAAAGAASAANPPPASTAPGPR